MAVKSSLILISLRFLPEVDRGEKKAGDSRGEYLGPYYVGG